MAQMDIALPFRLHVVCIPEQASRLSADGSGLGLRAGLEILCKDYTAASVLSASCSNSMSGLSILQRIRFEQNSIPERRTQAGHLKAANPILLKLS